MKLVLLLGRFLFSSIFILAFPGHFTKAAIEHAEVHGIPVSWIFVPLMGTLSLLGGISVMLGYKAKTGAWFLVFFIISISFSFHRYWIFPDPITREFQQILFIKNLSLLGAAMMITYLGSGSWSLDKYKAKKKHR